MYRVKNVSSARDHHPPRLRTTPVPVLVFATHFRPHFHPYRNWRRAK